MRNRLTIAACGLLAACGSDPAASGNQSVINATVPDAPPAPAAMQSVEPPTPTPSATPTSTTVSTTPAPQGKDVAAAVATIDAYYRAIDAHDYPRAYRLWRGNGDASGQTLDQFAHGFAHTRSTIVATGDPAPPEGAAGSSYVTVPVTVSAIDDTGERQRFAGQYVLRRINDVPGSSASDRRWHLESASLKRTP